MASSELKLEMLLANNSDLIEIFKLKISTELSTNFSTKF